MSVTSGSISAAMAHYLGELYRLGGDTGLVSPSELAEAMHVSTPAAARMIERLEQLELVEREPYKGVHLTQAGSQQALRELRFHRMSEAFLVNVMEYGWHEAHDMADALAEVADADFINRMSALAGHPTRCPHGEPIPTEDGQMPVVEDQPLSQLEPPYAGKVSRVKVRDDDRLIYLADIGLMPGVAFELVNRAPFGGPVRLKLDHRELVLGSDLAEKIRVAPADRA